MPGSTLIKIAKQNMTASEDKEWRRLTIDTGKLWMHFWVQVLKNRGHSNATIAKEFEISESTVRRILKKEK